MSRALKFRAWYHGKMYPVQKMQVIQTFANYTEGMDVFTLVSPAGTLQTVAAHQVEIMQFTGMLDKNGTEIYEGDIVRDARWDSLFAVRWSDGKNELLGGQIGWILDDGNYIVRELIAFSDINAPHREDHFHGEVIGNIYETPELLKEQS